MLDDPLDDPEGFSSLVPDRSPEPTKEQLQVLYLFTFVCVILYGVKTHQMFLYGFKTLIGLYSFKTYLMFCMVIKHQLIVYGI